MKLASGLMAFIRLASLALCLLCFFAPASFASADAIDTCNVNLQEQYTAPTDYTPYTDKVVFCVENSIRDAVTDFLQPFSKYMQKTVSAMIILSIVVFGMRITSGEPELKSKAIGFGIRMGLVLGYSFALGGMSGTVYDIMHELIRWVCGGYTPWQQIDKFLGKLFGMTPGIVLFQGMVGIVGSALLSSSAGGVLFMTAITAILDLLWFIFRIVYTYLTVCVLLGFLLCLSPLMVPLGIFFHTERYVQKWIDMIIGNLLIPVLLFAFLNMFLGIFCTLISDIFAKLGFPCSDPKDLTTCVSPDFKAYFKINQPVGAWTMMSDSNYDVNGIDKAIKTRDAIPSVQTNVDSYLHNGVNAGTFNHPSIDFGPANVPITQAVILCFTKLWIFSSLMKSMIGKIPEIAANITGTLPQIQIETASPKEMVQRKVQEVKQDAKFLVAGGAMSAINNLIMKKK